MNLDTNVIALEAGSDVSLTVDVIDDDRGCAVGHNSANGFVQLLVVDVLGIDPHGVARAFDLGLDLQVTLDGARAFRGESR